MVKRRKIHPHRDANHLAESRSPRRSLLVIATITKRVDEEKTSLSRLGGACRVVFFPVSPIGRSNPHLVSRSRVTRQSSVVHSVIWTGSSIFTKYRVRRAFDLPSGRRQFIVYTRVYTRGRLIEQ